jgi:tetratricopeptide (TPR) repeat protein
MEGTEKDDARRAMVVNRFLREYLADRAAGRAAPLAAYQARFPGFEAEIAREFERLSRPAELPGEALGSLGLAAGARVGPFRLVAELGRGGQGSVWRADDTRLTRTVALKLLQGWTPEALARFRREAELASRLEHPGICTIYEAGIADGVPFAAMRFVEGETLARRFARLRTEDARPDPRVMAGLIEQAAFAIAAAHDAGVIHRDVKPANLMLDRSERVVALDFGLAREIQGGTTLTSTGDQFGTPAYMAPEQIEGRPSDRRTDVWGLGVTLYEALTLRQPFRTATREALYRAILSQEPEDPRRVQSGIPRDLAAIVATALHKDPERRYASARDLAEDLRALREGRAVSARTPGPLERVLGWARREPRVAALVLALGTVLLALAGSGGYLAATREALQAGSALLAHRARQELLRDVIGGLVRSDRSEAELRRTLVEEPRLTSQRAVLALELSRLGRLEEARRTLAEAPADEEDPRALARVAAIIERRAGEPEKARALEDGLGPPTSALECYFASLAAETDGLQDGERRAFELARRAVLLGPEAPETYLERLLTTALGAGRREEAEVAADVLEARFPDSALAWFRVGQARVASDPERAKQALQRSLAIHPDFAHALVMMQGFLLAEGDFSAARAALERGIAATPADSPERVALAVAGLKACLRRRRFDDALWAAERILEARPNGVEGLLGKAEALIGLDRREQADEVLGRVLELEPESAAARRLLGF